MDKIKACKVCLLFLVGMIAAFLVGSNHDCLTKSAQNPHNSFRPGQVWLDTDDNPINAHGGGILHHKGVYYWYGEIKKGRTYATESTQSWGGTRVDVEGISCYSSRDLYNWKYEGNVLPATKNDPQHDLHPGKVVERPKVIFNQQTKKFVMWMHIDTADYKASRSGVAVGDSPTGQFRYLGSFRPNARIWPINVTAQDKQPSALNKLARDFQGGQMARDMTIFMDEDGKAYHFYSSEDNATMHISLLSDDYLHPSGKYARAFIGQSLEAATVFKRNGKYYLIASECTGWNPNPAHSAVAESIWGPWKEQGNPCIGKNADKTYYAQSTFVLPVVGQKGLFIFLADRWNQDNLPDSHYAWLPLEFNQEERLILKWRDQWTLMDATQKNPNGHHK
jgi:beta-galactosidase